MKTEVELKVIFLSTFWEPISWHYFILWFNIWLLCFFGGVWGRMVQSGTILRMAFSYSSSLASSQMIISQCQILDLTMSRRGSKYRGNSAQWWVVALPLSSFHDTSPSNSEKKCVGSQQSFSWWCPATL